MITAWKLAMLCLLPLMWQRAPEDAFDLSAWLGPKLRVWLAMMAGSYAAWLLPEVSYVATLKAYVLIDLAVGFIAARHPAGLAQRAIGFLSGVMAIMGAGHLWSVINGGGNPMLYFELMVALSWLRWCILFAWGLGDALGLLVHPRGDLRSAPAHRGNA